MAELSVAGQRQGEASRAGPWAPAGREGREAAYPRRARLISEFGHGGLQHGSRPAPMRGGWRHKRSRQVCESPARRRCLMMSLSAPGVSNSRSSSSASGRSR
ncbi:hypothetical protein Y1Q_0017351 [Alligator mississippiensis]|uniref:Uncharacterized protein n=1 Tax=Alligator mississippiensis TaxID=8496 RepID=A0A151NGD7_ALLMI|nr:hypothetical protein Y1Q_0017351 [Alligator mississippiensis]